MGQAVPLLPGSRYVVHVAGRRWPLRSELLVVRDTRAGAEAAARRHGRRGASVAVSLGCPHGSGQVTWLRDLRSEGRSGR